MSQDYKWPRPAGSPVHDQSLPSSLRIPDVSDALPYTTLSSIVPFNPDLITPPYALPASAPTGFDDTLSVGTARQELEKLSAGARNAEQASKRCQQTMSDVQKLLRAKSLNYVFKKPVQRPGSEAAAPLPTPTLSPFAQMVMDNSDVSYRYLTPESDGAGDTIAVAQKPFKAKSTVAESQIPAKPSQVRQNDINQVNGFRSNPPQSTPGYRVAVPLISNTLTPAQRSGYQYMSDDSTPVVPTGHQNAHLPKRFPMVTNDQRQKVAAAVDSLQTLLYDIFEQEDSMQPDTSGNVSMAASAVLATHDAEHGSVLVLQPSYQSKLDVAMNKVFVLKQLESIDTEHLIRVQRLCENAVAAVHRGSLTIGADWSETDVLEWLDGIVAAERGLTAARTLIRIMTESFHRKELQSEDSAMTALDALRAVTEQCIIPAVESRPYQGEKIKGEKDAPSNPKFLVASQNRQVLQGLLQATNKSLRALGDLFFKSDVDERTLSSVEYLCKTLIFAENATSDKESALGTQSFEVTRKSAMDVLSKVFTKHTGQRDGILQDILTSMDKLPATKQSARQFRLVDAKPIQLVSALLMRLVQTSATETDHTLRLKHNAVVEDSEESGSEESEDEDADFDDEDEIAVSATASRKAKAPKARTDLKSIVNPLWDAMQKTAHHIITMLLHRALTTSKSSEEPFRKLLDIFTDDFLNVFGSSYWPSAEILLQTLTRHLFNIADDAKKPAPSRTLALELLSTIGCGVIDIQVSTKNAASAVAEDDPLSRRLVAIAHGTGEVEGSTSGLTAFDGPYRVVVEYLQTRGESDPQLQTACGYQLMQWAQLLIHPAAGAATASLNLQDKVKNMILDAHWLGEHFDFQPPTTKQGQLAAKIVTSRLPLCRALPRFFDIILSSMSSEQPTIRSRSLKSFATLLDKDPAILDRNAQVIPKISRCMADPSSLVRDSALALVEKCVSMRPALEVKVYDRVISRTCDTAINVRKRAMKFLKQVYLRHDEYKIRSEIATALLNRTEDSETGVADIAKETMEDIWFTGFRNLEPSSERSVDSKLRFRAQAGLIVGIAASSADATSGTWRILQDFLKAMLKVSKHAVENAKVCKTLLDDLSEGIIDNKGIPGVPSQSAILRAMTVFAKTAPSLFTVRHLEGLEPYVNNLKSSDDLDVFHHAITVLCHTMPLLTAELGRKFMESLQGALLGSVAKLPKSGLKVVAPCLWVIDVVLEQPVRLRTFIVSVLKKTHELRDQNLAVDQKAANQARKLLHILGQFGNACDFQSQLPVLREHFGWFKGATFAELFVAIACPFTSPKQPLAVREAALDAVCSICEKHPDQYLRIDVISAFELVFKDRIQSLEQILLASLEVFFEAQESASHEDEPSNAGIAHGAYRLSTTYQATEHDKASTSISQRFLKHFIQLATSSLGEVAHHAAHIVVSVNRQGRTHPRESGPALVALETCPTSYIAKMAFVEHKNQAAKHESVYEKELIRGVQKAFEYQQAVVGSTNGYTGEPPVSKLHLFWEVLKNGKAKVRTKFFSNLCAKMDFDMSSLDATQAHPPHLLFARFCTEAVAFLDFDKVEETLHLVACLENIFKCTGDTLAQAIESEMLQLQIPSAETVVGASQSSNPAASTFHPARLRQLAVSSQILTLLWETASFLRRVWNLQKYTTKSKNTAKDSNRAPARSANTSAFVETYINRVQEIMNGCKTKEGQRVMCSAFAELISIDTEVKVGEEEDADGDLDDTQDGRSEGSSRKSPAVPGAAPRGKKRKSVGSMQASPKKRGRPRKSSASKGMDDDEEGGWI